MKKLILFFSGADMEILTLSSKKSKLFFLLSGLIIILFIISAFFFFYSFFSLKYSNLQAIVTSVIFAIPTIFFYFINLIFSEPKKLSRANYKQLFITRFIRFIILSILLFVIVKIIEFNFFKLFLNTSIYSIPDFLNELVNFNFQNTWIWSISISTILLFFGPFYLKFFLLGEKDYYTVKAKIEYRLIKEDKAEFEQILLNEIKKIHDNHKTHKRDYKRIQVSTETIRNHEEDLKNINSKNHIMFLYDWKNR
jgi:hypothetical protein